MASNPYQPGTTEYDVWNSANPPPGGAGPPTAPASGGGAGKDTATKRAELAAHDSRWNGASDAEVNAEYARLEAAAGSTGGNQPPLYSDVSAAAADRAVTAFLAKRRFEEIELPEFALKSETERARMRRDDALAVWKQAYERSQLGGYMPGQGAGKGQAVLDAIGRLRADARYQAADGATKRMMEAASVSQATGIDTASAAQAIERMRLLTEQTGQASSAELVESVLGQATGGTPTLERETEQNRTTIDTLRLLSTLRGPENAFAYANTIANLPPSIRANIQAAMGRVPFTGANPAQRGVLGDVGVGMGAQPQMALPPATGPRTALSYLPAPAAAMGQPALVGGGQTVAGGGQVPATTPYPGATTPAGQLAQQSASQYLQQATPVTGQQPGAWAQQMPWATGPRTTPAQQAGLPLSSQWSPTDVNRASPYAMKMLVAGYENAGEDPEHTLWQYKNALPRAYGPRSGTYRAA